MSEAAELIEAAEEVVDNFVSMHKAGAIPALIGACVTWAVEYGAADLVEETLRNARKMAGEMKTAYKATAQ